MKSESSTLRTLIVSIACIVIAFILGSAVTKFGRSIERSAESIRFGMVNLNTEDIPHSVTLTVRTPDIDLSKLPRETSK